MQYQRLLEHLATDQYSSPEEAYAMLVDLADGFWHNGASLTLNSFEGVALQKAAYALDLLVGFAPSVDVLTYRFTQAQLETAQNRLSNLAAKPFFSFEEPTRHCRDEVAVKWGLNRGASPRKVSGFLDLQRRSHATAA